MKNKVPVNKIWCSSNCNNVHFFVITDYVLMDGEKIFQFNLQGVIWWWQLICKDNWTPLSITKLGWSIIIKSKIDEGYVLYLWEDGEAHEMRRLTPDQYLLLYHNIVISPSHQVLINSWNLLISTWRLDDSNSCQLLHGQSLAKNVQSHLRIVEGKGRLQENNSFYYL